MGTTATDAGTSAGGTSCHASSADSLPCPYSDAASDATAAVIATAPSMHRVAQKRTTQPRAPPSPPCRPRGDRGLPRDRADRAERGRCELSCDSSPSSCPRHTRQRAERACPAPAARRCARPQQLRHGRSGKKTGSGVPRPCLRIGAAVPPDHPPAARAPVLASASSRSNASYI